MEQKSYKKHHDKHGKRHKDGKYASSDGYVDTKAEKFIARKKFELSKDESDDDDHPSMHMLKAERYVNPSQHGYDQNFDKVAHGYADHSHSFDTAAHGYARHSQNLDKSTHGYPGHNYDLDKVTRGYARHNHSFEKTTHSHTVYDHNFDKMTHGFAGYDHNSENSMHGYANYDLSGEGYSGQHRSNSHYGKERHSNIWNGARGGNHGIFPSNAQVERYASQFFKRFEDMGFRRSF